MWKRDLSQWNCKAQVSQHICSPYLSTILTFHGGESAKRPFSKDFLSKACTRFKSYDNFHGGRYLEIFYDLKGKSEKFSKQMGDALRIGRFSHFLAMIGRESGSVSQKREIHYLWGRVDTYDSLTRALAVSSYNM